MAQHRTSIEGTTFENRPEVKAAKGGQKQVREDRTLGHSEKLI